MMSSLNWSAAEQAMSSAVEYLRKTGSPKVGAIGFCMGGSLATIAATTAKVDCAVACYGLPTLVSARFTPELVEAPVLYATGELDSHAFSSPSALRDWASRSVAAGGQASVKVYPEVGHGFLNESDESKQRWEAAGQALPPAETQQAAWSDIMGFLRQHLNARHNQ